MRDEQGSAPAPGGTGLRALGAAGTSETIVQAAPDGFWQNALAFVQSPKFLACALIVVCLAWGITYYLRKRES